MATATSYMPLLERLRKGANCVVFLDGAPEPAADVADMLCKAADEIERLRAAIRCERASGKCVMVHDPEREPCTRRTCHFMGVVDQRAKPADQQTNAHADKKE